jgi:hypothetical protein
MCCLRGSLLPKSILIAALMPLFLVSGYAGGQTRKDPHRPACTDARCRKIESFLKAHYCGKSPSGTGPDGGCKIKAPRTPRTGIYVLADYQCDLNESKCQQNGQPSSVVRDILIRELLRLGLPPKAKGPTYFTVWKSTSSGWSLAAANHFWLLGNDIELCQVMLIIEHNSKVLVLRQVPFKKVDADVNTVTQWLPLDLADVEGNGQADVILEADAYENHWLEVVSVRDGTVETIFSGLGYQI